MRAELEEIGITRAQRRVANVADRAEHLHPALSDIADVLIAAQRRQFVTESGWRPLAASTRARKRRQGLPSKAMRETGRTERALTVRGAPGQLLEIGDDHVRVGIKGGRSPAYPGVIAQKGAGEPRRVVVPQPTRRTRREAADTVLKHLIS